MYNTMKKRKNIQSVRPKPYQLTTTKDGMICYLKMIYTGEPVSVDTILRILEYNHIQYGINTEVINRAINSSLTNKIDVGPIVIASGEPAPSDVFEKVDIKVLFQEKELLMCTANKYRSPTIISIEAVKQGTVVAVGKPKANRPYGKSIFGNQVMKYNPEPGHGITLNNDFQYISEGRGYITIENSVISLIDLSRLTVKVIVSDDKMKAEVVIEKKEFEEIVPTTEEVLAALIEAGVRYGTNSQNISRELEKIDVVRTHFPVVFTVAEGERAIEGTDAHITFHFPIELAGADFPEHLVSSPDPSAGNVFKSGEEIAFISKAQKEKNGRLVTGAVLQRKPPQTVTLNHDKFIETHEDIESNTIHYTMKVDGEVHLKGSTLIVEPCQDGYVEIDVSSDNLAAVLNLYVPQGAGEKLDFKSCMNAIGVKGIVYGIDEDIIKQAINKLNSGDENIFGIRAIKGIAPVDDTDEQLELLFTPQQTKPKIADDGSVDYYDLGPIPFVKEGAVIARKIPSKPGEPGKDIFGKEIPPLPGEKLNIKLTGNVKQAENGTDFIATTDGCPKYEGSTLQLVHVFQTKGDVNFTTGNIQFTGDIIVNGDVKNGFIVESLEGEIQVKGTVYDAVLKAAKSIKVAHGIIGKSKCKIKTNEDVIVNFLEKATIEAGGSVEAGNYIMNSTITVGGDIKVIKGRGLILGGQSFALQSIEAVTFGNEIGVKTHLYVGQHYLLINEINEIHRKIAELEKKKKTNDKMMQTIAAQNSAKESEEVKETIRKKNESIMKKIDEYNAEIDKRKDNIRVVTNDVAGSVSIFGRAYPGVSIHIKQKEMLPTSIIASKLITYNFETEDIKEEPLKRNKKSK